MIVDIRTAHWYTNLAKSRTTQVYECQFFVLDPGKTHDPDGIYRYYWVKRTYLKE